MGEAASWIRGRAPGPSGARPLRLDTNNQDSGAAVSHHVRPMKFRGEAANVIAVICEGWTGEHPLQRTTHASRKYGANKKAGRQFVDLVFLRAPDARAVSSAIRSSRTARTGHGLNRIARACDAAR